MSDPVRSTSHYCEQLKAPTQVQNQYLDWLIDPGFQGKKKRFELSFENEVKRKRHTEHFLPKVEIKDFNAMIDGTNVFDQLIGNSIKVKMKILEQLLPITEMITHLVVY